MSLSYPICITETVTVTIRDCEGVNEIICVSCLTFYRHLLICHHILNACYVSSMMLAADGFEITFGDITFRNAYK